MMVVLVNNLRKIKFLTALGELKSRCITHKVPILKYLLVIT